MNGTHTLSVYSRLETAIESPVTATFRLPHNCYIFQLLYFKQHTSLYELQEMLHEVFESQNCAGGHTNKVFQSKKLCDNSDKAIFVIG